MSELMRLVIALLRSGSDEGCDSLVVVDRKEFIDLRVYVAEKTGTVACKTATIFQTTKTTQTNNLNYGEAS